MTAPSWYDDALCAEVDAGDLWFPDKGRSPEAGKRICQACPVREACLAYAMAEGIEWGTWGGHTAKDRRVLAGADGSLDYVDPTPAREHAQALARTMTVYGIAKASGMGHASVAGVLRGTSARIRRSTAEAILTVPLSRRVAS